MEEKQLDKLVPIEHKGQRVLTTGRLAESYGTDTNGIVKNYNNNKERYISGKHYFLLEAEDLKQFKDEVKDLDVVQKQASSLYLWTEKGSWLQAKSLGTDEAWEAYEMLVDDYYRVKQQNIDTSQLSPELQMFKKIWDGQARAQIEQAEIKQLAEAANEKAQLAESTITSIKEAFLQRDDNWRDWVKSTMNAIVARLGGGKDQHHELRARSYQILTDRAECKLDTRLRNLRKRLEDRGISKTKINEANKLDVIEEEPRLKEIYTSVLKELSIGTL